MRDKWIENQFKNITQEENKHKNIKAGKLIPLLALEPTLQTNALQNSGLSITM